MAIETITEGQLAEIEISALPDNLKQLRTVVKETLHDYEIEPSVIDSVVLAIGEAAMNIVKHGFNGGDADGRIGMGIEYRDGELIFRLEDNAPPFEGSELGSRKLDDIRPGGLGVYFMRELMDSVNYVPKNSGKGNRLVMRVRIENDEM
jgi:sigma-B regulation protein RsbU (phosphoserine phosphatase)